MSLLENTPDVTQMSDEEVLALSLKHPACFKVIVERYQPGFLRTAGRVLRDDEEAKDAVQDAMIRIYRNGEKFRSVPGATFKSWAYRILMNVSINRYNKRKRLNARFVSVDTEVYEGSVAREEGKASERVGLRHEVAGLMERIPENFRAVLTKYYLEEKSQQEIAEEEGTTVASVKMRLFRARRQAKNMVEEQEKKSNVWIPSASYTTRV